VLPDLNRAGIRGGAYLGVGPDQNFSYIADIRPAVAFIVDIRRDNLLLHLLFKALFADAGTRVEYLAGLLEAYQVVKSLQARDLVIPVTGDLSGRHALAAIGQHLAARGERVSAIYASNVEFYLSRSGTLGRFVDNLRALPRLDHAVVIRSRFGGGGSISEIQPIRDLVGTRVADRQP
jgi:hypothetical protein